MKNESEYTEYEKIVEDIMKNEVFLQLDGYFHHSSSILEHAKAVSFLSYKVCKKIGLDYVSGARGALLHDFFLYDWREYKKQKGRKNHGLNHPKTALENSARFFELNRVEKDIILKHMWPKVLGFPRYPESWVVSCVDKFCACREFVQARPFSLLLRAVTQLLHY